MNGNTGGSGMPGSPKQDVNVPPTGGQTFKAEDFVPKNQYQELEKKLGEQGEELGNLRGLQKYFDEISPLLKKLDAEPKIVEAIMSDKLSVELAEAVLAGKVKIEDATKVAEAYAKVKEELGKKGYEGLSSEQVEELVTKKIEQIVGEKTKHLEGKVSEVEEKREFEDSVKAFVRKTKDFPEYADGVTKWFEDHPDQYDIEVAYNAEKGRVLSEKSAKEQEVLEAEEAKKLAANAGSGGSQGGNITAEEDIIDKLISSKRNPNVL